MSYFNSPKNLYVIYRSDTHDYLSDEGKWGHFSDCRLFEKPGIASELLRYNHNELYVNKIAKVLELNITKWGAHELRA